MPALTDPEKRMRLAAQGLYRGRFRDPGAGQSGAKGRARAEENASFGQGAERLANSRGIFDDE